MAQPKVGCFFIIDLQNGGCHVLPQTTAQVRERSDILEFAKWMRQKKRHSLKNQRECGMSHWTNCQPPDFWKNPVAIWLERIIPEKNNKLLYGYTINGVAPGGHALHLYSLVYGLRHFSHGMCSGIHWKVTEKTEPSHRIITIATCLEHLHPAQVNVSSESYK